jgi:hypothetical protein
MRVDLLESLCWHCSLWTLTSPRTRPGNEALADNKKEVAMLMRRKIMIGTVIEWRYVYGEFRWVDISIRNRETHIWNLFVSLYMEFLLVHLDRFGLRLGNKSAEQLGNIKKHNRWTISVDTCINCADWFTELKTVWRWLSSCDWVVLSRVVWHNIWDEFLLVNYDSSSINTMSVKCRKPT